MSRVAAVLLAAALGAACAAGSGRGAGDDSDDYIRYVAFRVPGGESVLLRWPERRMPLRVHLPRPPAEFVADPDAVFDAVRDGISDWSDAAGPGLPAFAFVDDAGAADIPIVWAAEPDGDWYIAHCAWDVDVFARRFGVSRILVTARWGDRREASLDDLYHTVLHEMGHALGLGGHSPAQGDVMYWRVSGKASGLTARDRETLRLLYARPIGHRVIGARRSD